MKTTAGLLLLVLLSTTACFQVEVPASKPAETAAAAAPAPAAEEGQAEQPRERASDDGAEAGRAHEDRAEGPVDHGWGESRSGAFERCMNSGPAAQGVQPAMLQCATSEEGRQDERLNQVYQERMASLDSDRRERLRDHQREWIRERDQKCVRDETGGTNAILEEHICKMDMTIERRVRLEHRG